MEVLSKAVLNANLNVRKVARLAIFQVQVNGNASAVTLYEEDPGTDEPEYSNADDKQASGEGSSRG